MVLTVLGFGVGVYVGLKWQLIKFYISSIFRTK